MADKTEEDLLVAQSIQDQVKRLNQTIHAASLDGIKTDLNVTNLTRIGSAPVTILSAEVSRVYTPVALTEAVTDQENGNG